MLSALLFEVEVILCLPTCVAGDRDEEPGLEYAEHDLSG